MTTTTPANDNYPPVLKRSEAAALCRLSPSGFDSWVARGIVPPPIAGTRRWSRDAILNAINGVTVDVEMDAYERQKAERNARKA